MCVKYPVVKRIARGAEIPANVLMFLFQHNVRQQNHSQTQRCI